jgi:L-ribulose-5-phosphate 3-epimerase
MPRIAIMQGRLLPPQGGLFQCFPRDRWRDEFPQAAAAGLDAIEWIYDFEGADVNPLATDSGIVEMQALARQHKIDVVSLCADYFMDRPFVAADPADFMELTGRLAWLLNRCRLAGITRMLLPFVDASRIQTPAQEAQVVGMLQEVLPHAVDAEVELHLETSLGPEEFARLLAKLPHRLLKANYDSGNSSSLGYDVRRELAAYGPRIGSVHIKDRVRGGGTVPLGQGNADIPALLSGLAAIPYFGDFVLQVARGAAGDEVEWARQNRFYLVRRLAEANSAQAGGAGYMPGDAG